MKVSLILAVGWSMLVIFLSSMSGDSVSKMSLFQGADKIGHFVFYFVCFVLWANYFQNVVNEKTTIVYSLIISVSLGLVLECCQFYFFEGRKFEFYDIIANIGGSIAGYLIYKIFK